MDEKFIIVWTIDGESMSIPHSTQDEALHQAEKLLREHGCDLEITLHLDDDISPPPSIWFNKKRMRQWCLAGFPASESKTRPACQSGRLFGRWTGVGCSGGAIRWREP
jgi:hypothetical protein